MGVIFGESPKDRQRQGENLMQASVDSDTLVDYEIFGNEGPPLLIITGTSLSWPLWTDFAKLISGEHQVICYDHRGIGASTRGSAEIAARTLAADAAALLDELGIERTHVLGWSLGSCVAQELAAAHPERVESLILANTWHYADRYQRAIIGVLRHLWSGGDPEMARTTQNAVSFSPELLDSSAFEAVMSTISPLLPQTDAQRQTVIEQWDADLAHDARELLPSITCPTLVVAGEQDLMTPLRLGQAVADLIPDAEIEIIRGPGSSHALAWERPEEFGSAVRNFLAQAEQRHAER
jgi:pimeloyl-ACP methyl ester carboxylesterase